VSRFIDEANRLQGALLPETIDEYVSEENPVRVIDAFVGALDLATLGFERVEPEATGRPAYHPTTMLKIYVYGYLNRIRSTRRLEQCAAVGNSVIGCGTPQRRRGSFPRLTRPRFRRAGRLYTPACEHQLLASQPLHQRWEARHALVHGHTVACGGCTCVHARSTCSRAASTCRREGSTWSRVASTRGREKSKVCKTLIGQVQMTSSHAPVQGRKLRVRTRTARV
jgi:hypothetical protein